MFIFGTDNTTLRAWPLATIRSVMFNPGNAESKGRVELALYLTDDTVVWLRGDEATETWRQIVEKGIGCAATAVTKS